MIQATLAVILGLPLALNLEGPPLVMGISVFLIGWAIRDIIDVIEGAFHGHQ